jgi:hypothetical protein
VPVLHSLPILAVHSSPLALIRALRSTRNCGPECQLWRFAIGRNNRCPPMSLRTRVCHCKPLIGLNRRGRSESSGVARRLRRLPQHRLNSARNVWLTVGGEMTSHGEFRRYFTERHPPRMQFLRNRYDFGASLSIRFPAPALAGSRFLAISSRPELRNQGCLFELGDRTKHLPDQHRGRRLFREEIRRCCRDQRDAQRFEEIMACELDGQVAREAIGGFRPGCSARRCRRFCRAALKVTRSPNLNSRSSPSAILQRRIGRPRAWLAGWPSRGALGGDGQLCRPI